MTHNTPAPVADKALAERLALLADKVTDDDLTDGGRYFDSRWHNDLTQCSHGDTGEFGNKADGKLIEMLWNAHRSGQLITLAEAQAMVAAETERCAVLMENRFGAAWGAKAIRAAATGIKEGNDAG